MEGKSYQRTLEYDEKLKNKEDEVEYLFDLLVKVKDKHPNVKGVSCGAILSDYQRNRVENVY
jgi:diphthine-ammonia ligase